MEICPIFVVFSVFNISVWFQVSNVRDFLLLTANRNHLWVTYWVIFRVINDSKTRQTDQSWKWRLRVKLINKTGESIVCHFSICWFFKRKVFLRRSKQHYDVQLVAALLAVNSHLNRRSIVLFKNVDNQAANDERTHFLHLLNNPAACVVVSPPPVHVYQQLPRLSLHSCDPSSEDCDSCDSVDANHFKLQSQQQARSMPTTNKRSEIWGSSLINNTKRSGYISKGSDDPIQ